MRKQTRLLDWHKRRLEKMLSLREIDNNHYHAKSNEETKVYRYKRLSPRTARKVKKHLDKITI